MLLLAVAQPIAGRLGHRTGGASSIEARSDAVRGPVTPPKGAFAIWGPIFFGNVWLAWQACTRVDRASAAERRIAWLNSAAFAANSAWSLQAQRRGLGWPSLAIIGTGTAAATAAMLEAEGATHPTRFTRLAAQTSGPLAGWLTVATATHVDATLTTVRGRPAPAAAQRRAVALIGAASGAAALLARAGRGNAGYAAAAGWGLGAITWRSAREGRPQVAAAAAAGLGIVLLACLRARRRPLR
ncbi:MAG: hypothetical protein M9885_14175 [Burkholderiaceae bacterium]|nr:hypothetical protein [Burkholderiaceae bacterium]